MEMSTKMRHPVVKENLKLKKGMEISTKMRHPVVKENEK